MSRTALIVKVAESEPVRRLRDAFASDAARGVPPHITVLFPFIPVAELDQSRLALLDVVLRRHQAFDFVLTTIGSFGDEVIWLAPADPAPFEALTGAVSAAFPDWPPYGGVHSSVVPHATVADRVDARQCSDIRRALARAIPVAGRAVAVTIIAEDSDGYWRDVADVPLARRG